jgi:UDP-2,3-diacylglucosamine pyrophosphatase LpxH
VEATPPDSDPEDQDVTDSGSQLLVFVSDFHLTGDPRRSPDEHDRSIAFTRFVEDLTAQLDGSGRIRLVVLGDMLDLTRVEARVPSGGALVASVRRLDEIGIAHAGLFAALGRFVSAGGSLDIVVGNHDLDLAQSEIQERFIDRLGVPRVGTGAMCVRFHPWFVYVRDVVYAEHGHRFHDINAVPVPGGRDVPGVYTPADVPLAAYLEAFGSAVRARGSARMLAKDLGTLTGALLGRIARERSHSIAPTAPGKSYLRLAADPGLDDDALLAINALSAHVGADTAVRVVKTIMGPPARLVLPYVIVAALIGLVLRGRAVVGPAIALTSVTALATLVRDRRRLWPPPRSTAYALEAAGLLQRAMEAAGSAVPFYVLGHTHVPSLVALDRPGTPATYLNTGSWTAADRGGKGYPFVRITRIGTAEPQAELLWWQSEASR